MEARSMHELPGGPTTKELHPQLQIDQLHLIFGCEEAEGPGHQKEVYVIVLHYYSWLLYRVILFQMLIQRTHVKLYRQFCGYLFIVFFIIVLFWFCLFVYVLLFFFYISL